MSRRNVDNIVIYSEAELSRVLEANNGKIHKSAKELGISVNRLKQYLTKYPSLSDIVYDRKEEILEGIEDVLLGIAYDSELKTSDRLSAIDKLTRRYGKEEYGTNSIRIQVDNNNKYREDVPLHRLLSNPENPYQLDSGDTDE